MKSIRQKAKAYDKALEIVRPYYEEAIKSEKTASVELFESMFDELRDNDEKIRKEIIDYIKTGTYHKDWIAWLEKQGKQNPYSGVSFSYNGNIWGMCARDNGVDILFNKKLIQHICEKPTDNVEPKFKVGDWVMLDRPVLITKVEDILYNTYQYYTSDGTWFGDNTDARLWTIKDAKDGDVLAEDSCIFIIQKLGDNNTAAKTYCTLYNDGDFDDGTILYFDIDSTKPATKKQCDILFTKMREIGYNWDANKKELKLNNPQITIGTKICLKTNPNVILSIISDDCHEDKFECSNGSVLSLKQIEKYYDIIS